MSHHLPGQTMNGVKDSLRSGNDDTPQHVVNRLAPAEKCATCGCCRYLDRKTGWPNEHDDTEMTTRTFVCGAATVRDPFTPERQDKLCGSTSGYTSDSAPLSTLIGLLTTLALSALFYTLVYWIIFA